MSQTCINCFFLKFSFNSDISNWDVGRVTDMTSMFLNAVNFNSDISNWNVGAVTKMDGMFAGTYFNSDISNWNVGAVTNMRQMFKGARSFNQNLCPWGSKLPSNLNYASAADMFLDSGCANKNKPTGPTGPWCAVTNCA